VPYQLKNVPGVQQTLDALKNGDANDQAKLEKVRKALRLLRQDPRHPGLNTYRYQNFPGVAKDVKVWHSYVENKTSSAWRIWWKYGPGRGVITILTIGPHDLC